MSLIRNSVHLGDALTCLAKTFVLITYSIFIFLAATTSAFAAWSEIRTAGGNTSGSWQYVTCTGGNQSGWQNCEPNLNIVLTATPTSIPATGAQSSIVATVTDLYGNSVGSNVRLSWTTSDGTLNTALTATDNNGQAVAALTSAKHLGGATVTAQATEYGGAGSIYVPFDDQWAPIASLYTAWAEYGAPYGCSAWTPDASTVAQGTTFIQNASCTQQYVNYRQDREQSVVTGAVRNVGAPVAGYTAGLINASRSAVGTLSTPTGACLETYKRGEWQSNNWKGTFFYFEGYNGYLSYKSTTKNNFIYNGRIQVLRQISPDYESDSSAGKKLEALRSNSAYWINGSDGGIYYPYDIHIDYQGSDTGQAYWSDSGVCVIKRPG